MKSPVSGLIPERLDKPIPCVLLGIIAWLLGGALFGFTTGIDDAHITYYSAWALLNEGAIHNYNGLPVEQSSSFLHVILTAALSFLTGLDVVNAGHLVPMLASLLILPLLYFSALRFGVSPLVSLLLLVLNPSFLYWSFSGLETVMVPFLLLLWLLVFFESTKSLTLFNAIFFMFVSLALMLARPEMPLFVPVLSLAALAGLFFFCRLRFSLNQLILMVLLPVLLAGLIFLLRMYFFADYFPQPVSAKSTGITLARLLSGFYYLLSSLASPGMLPVFFVAIVAVFTSLYAALTNRLSALAVILLICLCGYISLVILMGGDWMPAQRFIVPVIAPFVLLLTRYLQGIGARYARTLLLLILLGQGFTLLQLSHNELPASFSAEQKGLLTTTQYSYFERRARDNSLNIPTSNYLLSVMPTLLERQPQVALMSGQMGMISFHLASQFPGRIFFLDRNALVERSFTDCELTRDNPRGPLGLEGVVPYYYLLAKKKLAKQCAIPDVDIIFDIWDEQVLPDTITLLQKHGYEVVFHQKGHLNSDIHQVVAIRENLWREINQPHPLYLEVSP